MAVTAYDVDTVRARFSALGSGTVFLDAPGGSQVPDDVADAVTRTMHEAAANLGGTFATSVRVAEIVEEAHAAAGRFLGCDGDATLFGANMTTLNYALSRTAGRDLGPGDEIVVTRLDHDANVAPWLALAEDRGLRVVLADIDPSDCTLDLADLEAKIGERTRIVAFTAASNAVGSLTDVPRIANLAHRAGALAWLDATHYAAHLPIDVDVLGVDVLVCSPYKICGPHLGLAWCRPEVAAGWRAYKPRPAPDHPPVRRMATGTQPYEQLAGYAASVRYLESIGGLGASVAHTHGLGARFLDALPGGVRVVGRPTMEGRVPTFLLTFDGRDPYVVAECLVGRGCYVAAHDTFYGVGLHERAGYGSALRLGFFHYHTSDDVDAVVAGLREILGASV